MRREGAQSRLPEPASTGLIPICISLGKPEAALTQEHYRENPRGHLFIVLVPSPSSFSNTPHCCGSRSDMSRRPLCTASLRREMALKTLFHSLRVNTCPRSSLSLSVRRAEGLSR